MPRVNGIVNFLASSGAFQININGSNMFVKFFSATDTAEIQTYGNKAHISFDLIQKPKQGGGYWNNGSKPELVKQGNSFEAQPQPTINQFAPVKNSMDVFNRSKPQQQIQFEPVAPAAQPFKKPADVHPDVKKALPFMDIGRLSQLLELSLEKNLNPAFTGQLINIICQKQLFTAITQISMEIKHLTSILTEQISEVVCGLNGEVQTEIISQPQEEEPIEEDQDISLADLGVKPNADFR